MPEFASNSFSYLFVYVLQFLIFLIFFFFFFATKTSIPDLIVAVGIELGACWLVIR